MPKRRGHAVSGCHDGIRERPATGTGSPPPPRQAVASQSPRTARAAYRTAITKPTSSFPSAASSPGGTGPPSSWPSGPTE